MPQANIFSRGDLAALLSKHIGETVTIFTASGGQSGSGFTGVILGVTDCCVRLLTRIGPPPGCSLGNSCANFNPGYGCGSHNPYGSYYPADKPGAISAGGRNGYPVSTLGSIADIPIDTIVSFVHNAV